MRPLAAKGVWLVGLFPPVRKTDRLNACSFCGCTVVLVLERLQEKHRSMVRFYEVYRQQQQVVIIMEHLAGGMLFDHIARKVRPRIPCPLLRRALCTCRASADARP